MSRCFLGIDTSNYKTSVAAVDETGREILSISEFLPVKNGERGLRQETALFMHNSRLPDMITEIYKTVSPADIAAVSVSDKPRNAEGSYMPVFLAGLNCGRIITETLGYTFVMLFSSRGAYRIRDV